MDIQGLRCDFAYDMLFVFVCFMKRNVVWTRFMFMIMSVVSIHDYVQKV